MESPAKRRKTELEEASSREPERGARHILQALIVVNQEEHRVRLLVDSGAEAPILQYRWVKQNHIGCIQRAEPLEMTGANKEVIARAGKYYTASTELVMG